MPNEVENALIKAAAKIVQYVEDAGTLQVQTGYVQIPATTNGDMQFDTAKPVASTIIKFDGDCKAIIPLRETGNGALEVDAALLDLHQRSVDTAIEYRARILNALISALQSRGR